MTTHDSQLDDRVDDSQLDDSQLDDRVNVDLDDGQLVNPELGMELEDGQLYDSELDYEPHDNRKLRRQHLVGSVLLARIASAGLWLLVVGAVILALIALLLASSRSGQAPADVPEGDAVAADSAQRAAGFAQMAVRQYVGEAGQGAEDVMAPLLAGEQPDLEGVTPAGFYVVDATTVNIEDVGGGYWAATVAVALMAAVDGRYEPAGLRYYSAGVLIDDETGGAVLADLPSQVPPPAAAESPGLLAEPLGTPDDSPQLETVREFLGALLVGEGSIQRFTAPGTDIAALDPAPFTVLEIDGATITNPEADATAVRVSVLAADDRGLAQRLHYTLGMRLRAGRWEVAELFDAPLLSDESYPPPNGVPDS